MIYYQNSKTRSRRQNSKPSPSKALKRLFASQFLTSHLFRPLSAFVAVSNIALCPASRFREKNGGLFGPIFANAHEVRIVHLLMG